ncbi:MAG: hypothetical protein H8D23_10930 [Candidatus Brocadiales bacterium]|nr:hypothetical protein [Candidatus Brocadiales bacterium]
MSNQLFTMKKIVIEVRDNPQGIDISKLLDEIKKKMLGLGLFVKVTIEED